MECQPHEKLEGIERIIKANYAHFTVSYEVSADKSPYICVFQQQMSTSCIMNFLPTFYVIGTVTEKCKLSLKLITHHGKVLEEINEESGTTLTDAEKMDFVGNLICLEPCHGVSVLDYNLKLDPYTFTYLYLVEQLGQNVVIRSRQCQFALNNGKRICDMCSNLNKQCVNKNGRIFDLANIESAVDCTNNQTLMGTSKLSQKYKGENLCMAQGQTEQHYNSMLINERDDKSVDVQILAENVVTPKRKPRVKKATSKFKYSISRCKSSISFKCDNCTFATATRRNLIRHVKYNHQNKPHTCRMCLYATASRSSLIHHMDSVHAKYKEFKCEIPG